MNRNRKGVWLLLLILDIPATLITSWALMLLFGVLHHEVSAAIPPIGYGSALIVSLAFSLWNGLRNAFKAAAQEALK